MKLPFKKTSSNVHTCNASIHTHLYNKNWRIQLYYIYYKLKFINLNLFSIKSDNFVEINNKGIIDQTKIIIKIKKVQNMYDQIIFIKKTN
jgi:hypothetical protein